MKSVLTSGCLLTLVSLIPTSNEAKLKLPADNETNPKLPAGNEPNMDEVETVLKIPTSAEDWTPFAFINPEEFGQYFEGDIEMPLPVMARNGLIDKRYRWPNGEVPYVISEDFSIKNKHLILAAMEQIQHDSDNCITFHERTTEKDYIYFQHDNKRGCQSSVGKQGGKQITNYSLLCLQVFGTLQHEMLHFLGFYHEQSRYDRDDHITVLWQNVSPGRQHNFKSYSESTITGFGEGYDYDSIMHYSPYAFSRNSKKTVLTKVPKAKIGQRVKLSKTDIIKLKKMYECSI